MAESGPTRRLTTIVAADVAGYSRLTAADEEGTLAALRAHRAELTDPTIAAHGGRIANTAGDSLLIEFGSVVEALRCAIVVQDGMAARIADEPAAQRIEFRIGIHLGDVVEQAGDLLGDGVNVAARLEALAEPGGICLSDDAYRQVRDRVEVGFEDLGEVEVKNIARPVHVHRVLDEAGSAPALPTKHRPLAARATSAAFILLLVAGSGGWWWWQRTDVQPAESAKLAYALPEMPSIAVLPFQNMSGDPEQAYFADGMAEDVITDLSKLAGLFVIARNSSFRYRGNGVDVKRVGRELGVRYVLEGSVRRAGEKVRINAQLIDATSGGHLWAERYDGTIDDVFALQDRVTQKIVDALEVRLSGAEERELAARGTQDVEAYDLFVRARALVRQRSPHTTRKARELFERAIERDRGFSDAYAGLALTHWFDYYFVVGGNFSIEDKEKAVALARTSVKYRDNSLARAVLSSVGLYFDRDHRRALVEAERAGELAPRDPFILGILSDALVFAGESKRALEINRRMKRIDPTPPPILRLVYGRAHFAIGRFDEAADEFRTVNRLMPQWDSVGRTSLWLAASLAHVDRLDEARTIVSRIAKDHPFLGLASVRTRYPFLDESDAESLLDGLRRAGLE